MNLETMGTELEQFQKEFDLVQGRYDRLCPMIDAWSKAPTKAKAREILGELLLLRKRVHPLRTKSDTMEATAQLVATMILHFDSYVSTGAMVAKLLR